MIDPFLVRSNNFTGIAKQFAKVATDNSYWFLKQGIDFCKLAADRASLVLPALTQQKELLIASGAYQIYMTQVMGATKRYYTVELARPLAIELVNNMRSFKTQEEFDRIASWVDHWQDWHSETPATNDLLSLPEVVAKAILGEEISCTGTLGFGNQALQTVLSSLTVRLALLAKIAFSDLVGDKGTANQLTSELDCHIAKFNERFPVGRT